MDKIEQELLHKQHKINTLTKEVECLKIENGELDRLNSNLISM